MDKLECLRLIFKRQTYADKVVLQSIMTIQLDDPESGGLFKKEPNALYLEDGKFFFNNLGEPTEIEHTPNKPMFYVDEPLSLPGDFHPFLQGKPVETTFGIFLFNVVLLWDVFGPLIPYHNGEFTKDFVQGFLRNIMTDNPAEGETLPEGKASVATCMRFSEHCNFLQGLSIHFVRCSSVEALTVSPEVIALRDRLFKENADKLTDPVVFNAIIDEVVQLDFDLQMKGKSKTFYIEKKFIDNSRKRMFIAFGIEHNEEFGNFTPLTKSLDEGWDTTYYAEYINSSIEGSYNRGKATGEGGARVKETLRLIGRTRAVENDCGTPGQEPVTIEKWNKGWWTGSYYMANGKTILITKENVDALLDKTVQMRVPQFCLQDENNYCSVCLGTGLGAYANRVSADVVSVPTNMMLGRMKSVHVAGMSNTRLSLERALQAQ